MSKQSARRKHRDGRYLDDNEIVPEGMSLRVPVQLCDSMAGHRPGYADPGWREIYDRRCAFEARQAIDSARDQWRDGKRRREPEPDEDDDDDDATNDVRAPSIRARDEMVSQLRDAWRRPAEVGPGPAATLPAPSFGPAPLRPVPGASSDDDDSQKRRDRVAQEYATAVSSAWKMRGPAPGPQRAEVGPGIGLWGRPAAIRSVPFATKPSLSR
jgi:hypothetical protein